MAQLKDTVVAGSLRATDTLYATTGQFKIIKAATSSSNPTYTFGTAGQILKSNGVNGVYWADDTFSGTLSVSQGGTGATSFTANSVIISGSTTTAPLTTRGIRNNTTAGALGWTSSNVDITLVTTNTIAYWDGRYQTTNNNSNLEYCKLGKFGSLAIKDSVSKTDVGLANVTNYAQVTSLAYDSTNRKITYKISEGTATELVTFGTNAFTSYSNKITIGSKEITLGGSATLAEIGVSYPVTSVVGLTGAVTKAGLRSALDLSNVENTKLSTWAGTSNITTVGTITTGTWHGSVIESSYIGAHTHGNLTNDGKITSTATIANGDKLVIVDSDTTAASKITGSSITFDGSSIDKALTPKGTWEIFSKTDTKVEIIHL